MSFFDHLQQDCNYWLMRKRITNKFEAPIRIIYFGENDIERLGGWPVKRNIYGYLVEKLKALGVKEIGFHVYWGKDSDLNDENDLFLTSILNKNNNIIGSFYFENIGDVSKPVTPFPELQWTVDGIRKDLTVASGIQSPDKIFLTGNTNFGFVNLELTKDGICDEAILLTKYGDGIYPSFSNLIARNFQKISIDSSISKIKINFKINANHLPKISVREIIRPENPEQLKKELSGSIALIGVISSQLGFEKSTPIDPAIPVIGIHAQIVDNLIADNYLKMFPRYVYPIIFLMIIVLMELFKIKKLKLQIYYLSSCAGLFILLMPMFWTFSIIFQLYTYLFTLGLFLLIFTGTSVVKQKRRYLQESENRKRLEEQFIQKAQSAAKLVQENLELRQKYKDEIADLREELSEVSHGSPEIIEKEFPDIMCSANSPMIKVLAELTRIAKTDEPVLITGESGTGKELIAKAIHQKSERKDKPIIIVNCGALSESLLESELFGHKKGAFTGANNTKIGFFEAADKGTILLDEITETSPSFQAKLLRILQDGFFFKVGSTEVQKVNVRVIAATNKNIEEIIELHKFRQDLYFRLNVLPVHLPPLRDRIDDILLLLHFFLKNNKIKISSSALQLLKSYFWPGNIRELQNISARMKLLDEGSIVTSNWIKQHLSLNSQPTQSDSLDDEILILFRELDFRNDANSIIAQKVGNLHRSRITEYLKGKTFQFFFEEEFNMDKAIRRFNPEPDEQLDERIRNRMIKYLKYLSNKLDPNLSIDSNMKKLTPQIRTLPITYHDAAFNTAKSFLMGSWHF